MLINLWELADDRKSALQKIVNIEVALNDHLLYLLLFPQEVDLITHWKSEIITWLRTCIRKVRVARKVRFLQSEELFNVLYKIPFENGIEDYETDYLKNICLSLLWKKKNLDSIYRQNRIPVKIWKERLKKFYINISQLLSKGLFDIVKIELYLQEFQGL